MRIYDGTPRQDYEEVLRSIGAFLDQRAMRDVLLTEAPDGFIVQGLAGPLADEATWSENTPVQKETYTFLDDDITRFMEEAAARRGHGAPRSRHGAGRSPTSAPSGCSVATSTSRSRATCSSSSRTAPTSSGC